MQILIEMNEWMYITGGCKKDIKRGITQMSTPFFRGSTQSSRSDIVAFHSRIVPGRKHSTL